MALTDEQNNFIVEIYEISNRIPRIAVELFEREYNFKITRDTIRIKWKESGLGLQAQGGYRDKPRGKSHSPLYHLPNNPDTKYLRIRARKFN